jgi:hypothetical protein
MAYTPFQPQDANESEVHAFRPDEFRVWAFSAVADAKVTGSPFITGDNQRVGACSPIGSPFIAGPED